MSPDSANMRGRRLQEGHTSAPRGFGLRHRGPPGRAAFAWLWIRLAAALIAFLWTHFPACDALRLRGQSPGVRVPVPNFVDSDAIVLPRTGGSALAPNIVGGTNVASQATFPFMAVVYDSLRGVFCGGTLIAPRLVLTAGHCVAGSQPSCWRVLTYRRNLSLSTAEEKGIRYAVTRVIVHPLYSDATLAYDLGLLVLTDPENYGTFKPQFVPINREPAIPADGETLRVIGWGALSYQGPQPDILQQADIWAASQATCASMLGPEVLNRTTYLCAGAPQRDSCQGDSGGPLLVLRSGKWIQVGIVSFGTAGCADPNTYLAVYTRLSAVSTWIAGVVNDVQNGQTGCDTVGGSAKVVTATSTKWMVSTVYRTSTAIREVTRTRTATIARVTVFKTRTLLRKAVNLAQAKKSTTTVRANRIPRRRLNTEVELTSE